MGWLKTEMERRAKVVQEMENTDTRFISPTERERLTNYVATTRDGVLFRVRSLTRDQFFYKPSPERWSVAENLEHLAITANLGLSFIEKALQGAVDLSKRGAWQGRDDELIERVKDRSDRLQPPDIALPKGKLQYEQVLRNFDAVRNRIWEFARTTNAPLRLHFFPHPVYGEFDFYQTLLVGCAHCERHLAQIEEVLASEGFPSAETADGLAR